ncbi:Switch-associated protein 70 [Labeo rohita]|uniref:Switch-associated protein 70 n=2 Tax=Labeonini TaxID=2743697 RepID=A0ABQ8LS76_LABRO|nr:Switch-associated protein 70 [Labeo rohita]
MPNDVINSSEVLQRHSLIAEWCSNREFSHVTALLQSLMRKQFTSRATPVSSRETLPLKMGLRDELLKAIWHAFTALDVDKSGKVSKSQLKVLSHNLCTVMKIPHDPVALEEHFRDDDEGPVSNQGYMPYLNRFILDKSFDFGQSIWISHSPSPMNTNEQLHLEKNRGSTGHSGLHKAPIVSLPEKARARWEVQDNFDRVDFNRMCWTLCARKNLNRNHLLISDDDAFKIWCIFNFLSEDKYPLVMVSEEIEYFLRKLTEAMGGSWIEEKFEEYKIQLSSKHQCLNVWELIELVGMGHFSKGMDRQTLSMGINEVFQELILDVLKQGYMMKKGHKRKNWTERWFLLKPNLISYYASEDLTEKKGDILLDGNCCSLPDKEGKKCLFYVKCVDKSFEISASDKKKKQEWIQAIQTCITLLKVGRPAPHHEARQKRRELRQKQQAEQEELELRMRELQTANENKQRELEALRKKLEEAAANAAEEERRRLQTQSELQDLYRVEMEKEKMVRQQMEEQVAQKSSELEQYLQRVRELENMLLEEEVSKRAELEQIHLYQQQTISQTQAEKQELERERLAKESALQSAMQQLHQLEADRQGALEQYESWKDKVAQHEGLIRLVQPAFTEAELSLREKDWQEKKNRPATPQ